jgi:hypothetical protein
MGNGGSRNRSIKEEKDDPSTFSPTRNPTVASIATRPFANSASRYRLRVASPAFSAKRRGSKIPMGAKAPGISPTVAFMAEDEDCLFCTGAKAVAEAANKSSGNEKLHCILGVAYVQVGCPRFLCPLLENDENAPTTRCIT